MDGMKRVARLCNKGNKKQSKRILIGLIILSVFGIMVVVFQESFVTTRQEEYYNRYGAWSGAVYNVSEEVLKTLGESPDVKEHGNIRFFTNVTASVDGQAFELGTIEEEVYKLGRLSLKEGVLPKSNREIAMDEHLLKKLGEDIQVGAEVEIPLEWDEGGIASQETQRFTLSGILKSWGKEWQTERYKLPDIFIYDDTDLGRQPEVQTDYFFLGDSKKGYSVEGISELLNVNPDSTYVYNSLSYSIPQSAADKFFEQGSVIGIVCAVSFIIVMYLLMGTVKSKRYKIVLMKGLGADNIDLFCMTFWEAFYLWIVAAPIGLAAGIVSSAGMLMLARRIFRLNLMVKINWFTVLIVMAAIAVFVLVGYMVIVLTSVYQELPSSFRSDNSEAQNMRLPKIRSIRKLTTFRLYKKNRIFYRGRSFMRLGVVVIMIVALSLSIVRFFRYYQDYNVTKSNIEYKYELEIYDMEKGLDMEILQEFQNIKDIVGIDAKKTIHQMNHPISVHWSGWTNSSYISTLRKYSLVGSGEADQDCFETIAVSVIEEDEQEIVNWYQKCIDEGEIDPEKFINGEQCVLFLSPFYLDKSNLLELEYTATPIMDYETYERVAKVYEYELGEESIKPGDIVTIETVKGKREIAVGGIIRTVSGVQDIVRRNIEAGSGIVAVGEGFINRIEPTDVSDKYNYITLTSHANADYGDTDWQVENLINKYVGAEDNTKYHYQNRRYISEFFIRADLTAMLQSVFISFISLLLFVIIMYQGVTGKMETDENRIRIFRALGMTRRSINRMYTWEYVLEGLGAGVAGMILAAAIQFAIWSKDSSGKELKEIWEVAKVLSPVNQYMVHIYAGVFLLYMVVYLLIVLVPTKRILLKK